MSRYPVIVQSTGKIKRGPVVEVPKREWTEPIPDELLADAERAGLVLDDNDHNVIAYLAGRKYSSAWGPAVEGHWFVQRLNEEAIRVVDRDAALRHAVTRISCSRCEDKPAEGVCCSSHGKVLCHGCYRRTHFVERCVANCTSCAAEGIPVHV
jgi:hypothetical protein